MLKSVKLIVLPALYLVASVCIADQNLASSFSIRIKDHKFIPAELTLPANQKIKLEVINEDPTPEEFESHDLKREKIVNANSKISLVIGPLAPGEYSFFGEFNPETAQGKVLVK